MCLGLTLYLAGPGKPSRRGTGLAAAGGDAAIRITFISSSTRRQGKIRTQRESNHSPGHGGNLQKAWDGAALWGQGRPELINSEKDAVEWELQDGAGGGLRGSVSLGFKSRPSH